MNYKISTIEISSDYPFINDALNRQPPANALLLLIRQLEPPFVLGIDSPWGTGKTSFVKMLQAVLETDGFRCIYFNAWETDFSNDPMISFVGELQGLISHNESKEVKQHYKKVKKIASNLVKKGVPLAVRLSTYGLIDLDSASEKAIADFASDSAENLVDSYLKEKELLQNFRVELREFIDQKDQEKKDTVVIFVDELDRCRPTYAIELLERIKHIFNIKNVIFILSLDKSQLGISLGAIYGQGINSDEYLRRFIDLEYSLPVIQPNVFTKHLIQKFNFREIINNKQDTDRVIEVFTSLSELFDLSLRTREQCFTRIAVSFSQADEGEDLASPLVTALTLIKIVDSVFYDRFLSGNMAARELFEHLQSKDVKRKYLNSSTGAYIFAIFSFIKSESRWSVEYTQHEHMIPAGMSFEDIKKSSEREFAMHFIKAYENLVNGGRNWNLNNIRGRIELASRFN